MNGSVSLIIYHSTFIIKTLWWLCRGCSPLPIPNREVKSPMADGTGTPTGRVGSCHIYYQTPHLQNEGFLILQRDCCNKVETLVLTSSSDIIFSKDFAAKITGSIFAVRIQNTGSSLQDKKIQNTLVESIFFHKLFKCFTTENALL